MKAMLIKDVPDEIRIRFRTHCAAMDITMKEAILRLMDLEVENNILSSSIDQKPQEDKTKIHKNKD